MPRALAQQLVGNRMPISTPRVCTYNKVMIVCTYILRERRTAVIERPRPLSETVADCALTVLIWHMRTVTGCDYIVRRAFARFVARPRFARWIRWMRYWLAAYTALRRFVPSFHIPRFPTQGRALRCLKGRLNVVSKRALTAC
jgi:hypothetical protein